MKINNGNRCASTKKKKKKKKKKKEQPLEEMHRILI